MSWLKLAALGILAASAIYATQSDAKSNEYYIVEGKQSNKIEAMRSLIQNSESQVFRCVQVEITEKATLRNKKLASRK